MENKKLVIPSKKFRGDSMVVSTRLPNELVNSLDNRFNQPVFWITYALISVAFVVQLVSAYRKIFQGIGL